MNIVTHTSFTSATISHVLIYENKYQSDYMSGIFTIDFNSYTYTMYTNISSYIQNDDIYFSKNYVGNGSIAGGTYLNDITNIFESEVMVYDGEKRISQQKTINGKFSFKYLNSELNYSVKAIPLDTSYSTKTYSNIKPVINIESFKFILYCNYDKNYNSGTMYFIQPIAYDTYGTLTYNLDNAPLDMTIDELTGLISFNINTIGTYNFTVNCSDDVLAVTKSINMQINII